LSASGGYTEQAGKCIGIASRTGSTYKVQFTTFLECEFTNKLNIIILKYLLADIWQAGIQDYFSGYFL